MKESLLLLVLVGLVTSIQSLTSPACAQTWAELRHDGLKAKQEKNPKEAANKLKGALLKAMGGKPANAQELQSRKDLEQFLKDNRNYTDANAYAKLSRDRLKKRLKQEYDPDVWYDVDGVPRNNVIPKDKKMLGYATMLDDKSGRVDLQWWQKDGERYTTHIYKKDHPWYQHVITEVGGLKPGEIKSVYEPFPRREWTAILEEKIREKQTAE